MPDESPQKAPKFAWPPLQAGDPGVTSPSDPPQFSRPALAPLAARVSWSWLHQIEQDWVGLLTRPVFAELAAADWQPDTETTYCPRCGKSVTAFELLPIEDDGEEFVDLPQGSRRDCSSCFRRRLPWDQFVRLGSYDGPLRDAVLDTKFRRSRSTGLALGQLLGIAVAARARQEGIATSRILLVPVPMHPWRRLTRGIDHTLTIARGMRQALPGSPVSHLLKRRGLRPTQVEIAPSARRANVAKTIVPASSVPQPSPGQLVVVIDDVRTTGATLGEACRSLRGAFHAEREFRSDFVRIWATAVAVSEMDINGQEVARSGSAITS